MSDTYVIKDQLAPYFLTFQVVSWVDVFTKQVYRYIVIDSFNFCVQDQFLNVHAWVMMSNHVHCILSSRNGALSNTIGNLKKHMSKQILKVAQPRESRWE